MYCLDPNDALEAKKKMVDFLKMQGFVALVQFLIHFGFHVRGKQYRRGSKSNGTTTLRRRADFSIKGNNNVIIKNSIGNSALVLELRMWCCYYITCTLKIQTNCIKLIILNNNN